MRLYAGFDLHSNNIYAVIINELDQVVGKWKLATALSAVLAVLEAYREKLVGIVVESTYNWYWLVDGLQDAGWTVHLANPAGNDQYRGIKSTNDWTDAQWLAHLLRLGILKTGYIYPKQSRPLRDLLRERMRFVQECSAHIISLEGMIARQTGHKPNQREVRKLERDQIEKNWPEDPLFQQMVASRMAIVTALEEQIEKMEQEIQLGVVNDANYQRLQSIYGIGKVLARTILLEVGSIRRFQEVGNYTSYCRLVESKKTSNGKQKGENNRKCGNAYLCWAYMEAAHFATRYYPEARAFVDRKAAKNKKYGRIIGYKALASKLCRASYHMMRDGVEFDPKRVFGS